jgi:hypothetical protein
MRLLWLPALLQAAAAARAVAQGGPPLETDDPGTPGPGRLELNVSLAAEGQEHRTFFDAPRLDGALGLGERAQLKVEVPWRIRTGRGEQAETGAGNVVMGVKWRFLEAGALAVSTYPQVTLGGFERARANGLADPTGVFLPVEAAWESRQVSVNAELGYELSQGASEAVFGLAVGHHAGAALELLGECHGSSGSDFSDTGLLCGGGARWQVRPSATALVAIGVGVLGSAAERPDQRVYTGMQLRW